MEENTENRKEGVELPDLANKFTNTQLNLNFRKTVNNFLVYVPIMGYIYTRKLSVDYLKFKYIWASPPPPQI